MIICGVLQLQVSIVLLDADHEGRVCCCPFLQVRKCSNGAGMGC